MPEDLTPDAVESVAGKLEQFAKGLPDQERAILGWIVARAGEARETVSEGLTAHNINFDVVEARGTGLTPGFQSQLGRAVGFTDRAGAETQIHVEWSW